MKRAIVAVAMGASLLFGGCDSEPAMEDAGTDAFVASGVVMTVDAAEAADAVAGISAGDGFQYYVLDVTLEARGVGPISVAPNAFMVRLEGQPAPVNANFRTGEISDGCRSQMVAADASLSCRALFTVPSDAPPPMTLEWADATYSATASVPPLATE